MTYTYSSFRLHTAVLLFFISLLSSCNNVGTTTTFHGTVTDKDSKTGIAGVAISINPIGFSTETDENGAYSIALPRTDMSVYLVFTCPGYDSYQTQEMPLSPKKINEYEINASLQSRIAKAALSTQTVAFGASTTSIDLQLSNPGTDELLWNIMDMAIPAWLTVAPTSGTLAVGQSQTITFTADRSSLELGTQTASLTLLGGQEPLTITVTVSKEGCVLETGPTSFDFGQEENTAQTTLHNAGNIAMDWQLETALPAWLTWDATQGSVAAGATQTLTFNALRDALDYGTTTFTAQVHTDGGDVSLAFSITKTRDLIDVTPLTLDFGSEAVTRSFNVQRAQGIHDIAFTVSCQDPCLSIQPVQGTITGDGSVAVEVTLDRNSIPIGTSQSSIDVTAGEQHFTIAVTYASAAELPVVATGGTSLDDQYHILLEGTLTSGGGGSVTQHGHCWGTMTEPTLEDGTITSLGNISEGQTFTSIFDGTLERDVTYYYRAYATNEVGTAYGLVNSLSYLPVSLSNPTITVNGTSIYGRSNLSGYNATQPVLQHGFCLSLNPTPDINNPNDTVIALGELTSNSPIFGQFHNIARGYTYYLVSYAINLSGLTYSQAVPVTINIEEPEVYATETPSALDYYSATLQGEIYTLGSEAVLDYGHCWGTSQTPTIEGDHSSYGAAEREVSFTSELTGLLINTTYYFRSYVRTARAVYYSTTYEFSTLNDASVVVSDGLTMYITSNSTPRAYEWTGRAPDLTVSSGVTYATSNKPSGTKAAFSFNGSSAYMLSPNYNPISGVSSGSISFWLRFRSTMNKSLVYPLIGSISDGGMYIEFRHNGDAWVLTLCMGKGKNTYTIALPSFGGLDIASILGTEWHMITLASSPNSMAIYMDGSSLPLESLGTSIQMSFGEQDDFVIGANALNGTTLNTFISADMACMRFYNRVISEAEIKEIYSAGM